MKPASPRPFLPLLLSLATALFMAACGSNDIRSVNAITNLSTGPLMSARDIEVTFSDSGRVEAKLYSPLMSRYSGTSGYMEFPKGFRIEIFDTAGRVETTIRGDYGKRFEEQRIMEARRNVVVRNELKNKQLETEHLKWDENRRVITSDVNVRITTADKVLYGKGLEANEAFTWYRILQPSGQMMVNKDSI